MNIEILSTGNELTTGALADTNAAFISEYLTQNHLTVNRHHAISDDLSMISSVLKEISHRSDILIATGGLGPTTDDLTAEAVAKAINKSLVFNQSAYDAMCRFFERIKRPMNPSNKKQAYLPEGAEPISNPVGTASGFKILIGNCHAYFLPGVPHEMKKMIKTHVLPDIFQSFTGLTQKTGHQTIVCFGLTESAMGDTIKDIPQIIEGVQVGTRSMFPELQIKLYATGETVESMASLLYQAEQICLKRLGKYIISTKGESIQEVVGNLLREKKATLAIAESCTGGLIAHKITEVPGSSDYFLCGAVTYANEIKMNILDVSAETIQKYGAVSEETVIEMVSGICKKTNAKYCLATSGVAGPGGGTPEKPVGTLCMAVAYDSDIQSQKIVLPFGTRKQKKELFAMAALDMLRRKLLHLPFLFEE
jgi:nicotinamide-nucleotide amidase